jgi:polygalacturonase
MTMYSRRALLTTGALTVAGALTAGNPAFAAERGDCDRGAWAQVPRILARVRPPRFPRRSFPITRYGAVGDGLTDNTEAFAKAIAACHCAGGGRVLVPAGAFLTGAIHLRSNVELHVSDGATIRFSPDPATYLPVVLTRWEGTEC